MVSGVGHLIRGEKRDPLLLNVLSDHIRQSLFGKMQIISSL
jgi:hypothetical protein